MMNNLYDLWPLSWDIYNTLFINCTLYLLHTLCNKILISIHITHFNTLIILCMEEKEKRIMPSLVAIKSALTREMCVSTHYIRTNVKPNDPKRKLRMNVAFIVTERISWVASLIISSSGTAVDWSPLFFKHAGIPRDAD